MRSSSTREVFGGELELATYADFGRTDGPGEAIAHGMLQGCVDLFAADSTADSTADSEKTLELHGLMFSLLGSAEPAVLQEWFNELSESGGRVIDRLQRRSWGDYDGTVVDRHGVTWLIGYKG